MLLALLALATPAPEYHVTAWGLLDAKTVYLLRDGGVDAVDRRTGEVRWKAEGVVDLVAVAGGRVLTRSSDRAKPNVVRVAQLDAATGKKVAEADPIALPDWVVAENPPWGRSFHTAATVVRGELYLEWSARGWYGGGARPTPAVEKAARKSAEGVVRVDLRTGKVDMTAKGPAASEPVSAELAKAIGRKDLRRAGEVVFAVEKRGDGLALLRWDAATAKPLPAVVIGRGGATARIGLDQASVLLQLPPTAEAAGRTWAVVDPRDGEPLGRFATGPSVAAADAAGRHAFALERAAGRGDPRRLRVFDYKEGKELWARPARTPAELTLPK